MNKENKAFESVLSKLDTRQASASLMIDAMVRAITSARLKKQEQETTGQPARKPNLLTRGYLTYLYEQTSRQADVAKIEETRKDDDLRLAIHRFLFNRKIDVDTLGLTEQEKNCLNPVTERLGQGRFAELSPAPHPR